MLKLFIVTLFIYLISCVKCEEHYQNSSHICEICSCRNEDVFIMDCTNKTFEHVLANWPAHNKSLIATFSYNNITTLERLPVTNQTAKILFDHCNIKYLDSRVFSNMPNVEFVDLSYNLLTTDQISGEDFKGPYSNGQYASIGIKYLNLAYNQIHSLPQKLFQNMPQLEELNLEGNNFLVLDPSTQVALGALKNIKVLNLANNKLTEIEAMFIRKLHTLVEIDLSSNHLDFIPKSLNLISKNLKVLKMNNNYIFQLTDKSFFGFNLRELYLNNQPRLKIINANTFATQKNLKKLSLSGNLNLQVIDSEAFANNQILDELDLSNNSLTNINFMLDWRQLKKLRIDSNLLECSCSLFNITKVLPSAIKRNLDGLVCTDEDGLFKRRLNNLDNSTCSEVANSRHMAKVMKHFNTIRIVLIVLSTILLTIGGMVIAVGVLRYRKNLALRNYPFAAQVNYYPIQTQHI